MLQATKADLKAKACELMQLRPEDVHMWDFYNGNLYASMEDQLTEKVTGDHNALLDRQPVLLEEKVTAYAPCQARCS